MNWPKRTDVCVIICKNQKWIYGKKVAEKWYTYESFGFLRDGLSSWSLIRSDCTKMGRAHQHFSLIFLALWYKTFQSYSLNHYGGAVMFCPVSPVSWAIPGSISELCAVITLPLHELFTTKTSEYASFMKILAEKRYFICLPLIY